MKTDVLVIGSSAAGLVAATTAKRVNKDKSVTVITKQPKTLIPCGIPYIFGTVHSSDKDILPAEKAFEAAGVDILHDEVLSINCKEKTVEVKNAGTVSYDKLVLGTGSTPYHPTWLKGSDLKNVFAVPKDKVYLDEMQKQLEGMKKIIAIGAGFIGVELSDELRKAGKEVTLVEKLPHILGLAFDEDICLRAEKILSERGVNIITGTGVTEIVGTEKRISSRACRASCLPFCRV